MLFLHSSKLIWPLKTAMLTVFTSLPEGIQKSEYLFLVFGGLVQGRKILHDIWDVPEIVWSYHIHTQKVSEEFRYFAWILLMFGKRW